MSFPSLRNPADYENYKSIYLQTLQQQINNNATTYNSISLYQKTAQPPVTPTDTRSNEDKFADLVYVQVEVRKLIRTITDDENTNDIMDDIKKDKQLLIFTYQNFPAIKEYAKKYYSAGIKYPIFMNILRAKYNQYKPI